MSKKNKSYQKYIERVASSRDSYSRNWWSRGNERIGWKDKQQQKEEQRDCWERRRKEEEITRIVKTVPVRDENVLEEWMARSWREYQWGRRFIEFLQNRVNWWIFTNIQDLFIDQNRWKLSRIFGKKFIIYNLSDKYLGIIIWCTRTIWWLISAHTGKLTTIELL